MHRPPEGNIGTFIQHLENIFSVIKNLSCTLMFGGELNIGMLSSTYKQARFSDILVSFLSTNVITMPTHITAASSGLLDLFITSSSMHPLQAGALDAAISDCLPVYFTRLEIPLNERSHVAMATHF